MTKHDDLEGKAIDYLLGELDEAEAREFEAELDAPAHRDNARELAEYQALTAAATRALRTDAPEALHAEQRESLLREAQRPAMRRPWYTSPALVRIAALLIVGVVLGSIVLPKIQPYLQQDAHLDVDKNELLMRINRLPGGAERLLTTDLESSSANLSPERVFWQSLQHRDLDDPKVRQQVARELDQLEQPAAEAVASDLQAPEQLAQVARLNESSTGVGGLQNVEVSGAIRVRGDWYGHDQLSEGETSFTEQRPGLQGVAGAAPPSNVEKQGPVRMDYAYPSEAKEQAAATSPVSGGGGFGGGGGGAAGYGRVGDGSGGFGGGFGGPAPTSAHEGVQHYKELDSYDIWGTDFRRNQITGYTHDVWAVDDRGRRDNRALASSEQYQAAQEQQLVTVAQQPLSTFSIDVDTASYSNIRRMLNQGQWPPADAVRIEEMINYFDYIYGFTGSHHEDGQDPFHVNVDLATCPWAPERVLARVGLQGKDVPRGERPPANLVFLIDVSGSMNNPNKLPLVKESMKALLETLQPEDRVGIVTYAGDARVALPSTSCDDGEGILRAIESLSAGGSTNGEAGIGTAYAMAKANFIEGGINRVILATDGDFNVGVTDAGSLLDLIAQQARGKVFLTVLGFGMGNLKDGRLEELSNKGNGNYAYIDSFAEARKTLVEQVNGTLMTIAKDVKIQVEFNPARVQAYRLIGYDNRVLAARDFNDDTKDAGEIGAGHQVTALYEIVPVGAPMQPGVDPLRYQSPPEAIAPPLPVEPSDEWMTVKLRYKQPEGDVSQLIEVPVSGEPLAMEQVNNTELRFAAAVAAFGLVLRESQYKGSASLDMALALAKQAEWVGYHGGDPVRMMRRIQDQRQQRQEFVDLVVRAKTLRQ